MKSARILLWALGLCLLAVPVPGQTLQFSFDDLPAMRSLPMDASVGGLTAHLVGTGQNFSIQSAGVLGFTPAGFSGNSIYPNSVYAADLQIQFSKALNRFSIMYAPEEYACDSSARMRVTAFWNGLSVGTATATAAAGTWPTGNLKITTVHPFNSVVVHYDAPPPTGGDWGPIFMADNMSVTLDNTPFAVADQYSLSLNSTLNVPAPTGLLKNDLIASGATTVLVSNPIHGSLTLSNDGSFSYTPTLGFVGTDRFVYQDLGGGHLSNPTSVTLLVQPKLTNLTLKPILLLGGTTLVGSVTLSTAAPTGGTRVFVSDDSVALFEAASVLVPTGATSAAVSVSSQSGHGYDACKSHGKTEWRHPNTGSHSLCAISTQIGRGERPDRKRRHACNRHGHAEFTRPDRFRGYLPILR